LKGAAGASAKEAYAPFGETAADRMDPGLRQAFQGVKTDAAALDAAVTAAEKRAGIATSQGDTLATMLEKQATGATQPADATASEAAVLNKFISVAQKRIFALRQRGQ